MTIEYNRIRPDEPGYEEELRRRKIDPLAVPLVADERLLIERLGVGVSVVGFIFGGFGLIAGFLIMWCGR